MKAFFSKFLFLTLLLTCAVAFAQEPFPLPDDPKQFPTLVNFLSWYEYLYGAVVLIVGYLTAYIPGINKIPSVAWRVFAAALCIAGIFLALGASGIGLAFNFLLSTNLYNLIFQNIFKTPKAA